MDESSLQTSESPDGSSRFSDERSSVIASESSASWKFVERYCEHHEGSRIWMLVFKRGLRTLEIPVSEESWRAFDE
jgi:hypothetical protein